MSKMHYENGRLAQIGDMVIHPALGHRGKVRELGTDLDQYGHDAKIEHDDNKIVYSANVEEWLHQEDHKPVEVADEPKGEKPNDGKPPGLVAFPSLTDKRQ